MPRPNRPAPAPTPATDPDQALRDRIARNARDRELFQLVVEENPGPEFYRLVSESGPGKRACAQSPSTSPSPGPITPFTQTEAYDFENQPMPFGKYSGYRIRDVPLEYLQILANSMPFVRKLNRYLLRIDP